MPFYGMVFLTTASLLLSLMSKPRVVNISKPEVVKKPKIVETTESKETEEDYSLILQAPEAGDASSQKLRKQQLSDITPIQPKLGQPFQAVSDDVREKIEQDRKKRRGLGGGVKDLFGLK